MKVEIQTEITQYQENNDNESTIEQNLWDVF